MVSLGRENVSYSEGMCSMIVEYEIDFKYFIKLMQLAKPGDMRCQCALRLLEIACYENGRFVIRKNDENIQNLRKSLISGNNNGVSVSLFDVKRDYVLSEYCLGLLLPYGVISERPSIRILEGDDVCPTYHIGDGDGQVGLVQYFQTADAQRRSYLGKQTFLKSGLTPNTICFEGFDKQLKVFAANEDKGFVIVDPYCLGGTIRNGERFLEEKVKVLIAWLYHLVRGGENPLRFDIYTSCPYYPNPTRRPDDEDYQRALQYVTAHLSKNLRNKWKQLDGTNNNREPIKINFVIIRDEDRLFHDRFIGSSTHYFSMGKGLDGVLARDGTIAYNIYYCGKRNIREEPDIKRILDYARSREEGQDIKKIECSLIN